jgi:subtilisin family serine protease
MDFLAGRGTRVLNLSLAGPPNAVLEEAIARLAAAGVVVVAAAGNGGPRAEPAYPAAYPTVIAVTAVDRSGAIYRRAGRGDHIDIAAPGVEVWTAASVRGARPKTGTSFAAPFVSAAAALLLGAEPNLAPADVRLRLKAAAQDLGETGEDPVFGAGLVQATGLCSSQ